MMMGKQYGYKKILSVLVLLFVFLSFNNDGYGQQQEVNDREKVNEDASIMDMVLPGRKTAILHPGSPNLITQAIALTGLALLPFLVMLLTSFVKIVVVLSLLRNALGAQQAPPNQVVNGVALLLTIYIMFPTGVKMYNAAQPVMQNEKMPSELMSAHTAQYVVQFVDKAKEPFRDFMVRNSETKHRRGFHRIAYQLLPPESKDSLKTEDFIVLIPSFITGQLKAAFEIGVLIYIPFFVVDLVTANILLAMGMMMLSPVTISMPLKLFLLVMLDGWTLLVQGLVGTFR